MHYCVCSVLHMQTDLQQVSDVVLFSYGWVMGSKPLMTMYAFVLTSLA